MTQELTIITGASRGMGLELALQLLQPGQQLLCISRQTSQILERVLSSEHVRGKLISIEVSQRGITCLIVGVRPHQTTLSWNPRWQFSGRAGRARQHVEQPITIESLGRCIGTGRLAEERFVLHLLPLIAKGLLHLVFVFGVGLFESSSLSADGKLAPGGVDQDREL